MPDGRAVAEMPTLTIAIAPPLPEGLAAATGDGTMSWREEVARGETLGRLLARLTNERTGFGRIYDPTTRRLAEGVMLEIDGRNYELVGGMTYLLREGNTLTILPS